MESPTRITPGPEWPTEVYTKYHVGGTRTWDKELDSKAVKPEDEDHEVTATPVPRMTCFTVVVGEDEGLQDLRGSQYQTHSKEVKNFPVQIERPEVDIVRNFIRGRREKDKRYKRKSKTHKKRNRGKKSKNKKIKVYHKKHRHYVKRDNDLVKSPNFDYSKKPINNFEPLLEIWKAKKLEDGSESQKYDANLKTEPLVKYAQLINHENSGVETFPSSKDPNDSFNSKVTNWDFFQQPITVSLNIGDSMRENMVPVIDSTTETRTSKTYNNFEESSNSIDNSITEYSFGTTPSFQTLGMENRRKLSADDPEDSTDPEIFAVYEVASDEPNVQNSSNLDCKNCTKRNELILATEGFDKIYEKAVLGMTSDSDDAVVSDIYLDFTTPPESFYSATSPFGTTEGLIDFWTDGIASQTRESSYTDSAGYVETTETTVPNDLKDVGRYLVEIDVDVVTAKEIESPQNSKGDGFFGKLIHRSLLGLEKSHPNVERKRETNKSQDYSSQLKRNQPRSLLSKVKEIINKAIGGSSYNVDSVPKEIEPGVKIHETSSASRRPGGSRMDRKAASKGHKNHAKNRTKLKKGRPGKLKQQLTFVTKNVEARNKPKTRKGKTKKHEKLKKSKRPKIDDEKVDKELEKKLIRSYKSLQVQAGKVKNDQKRGLSEKSNISDSNMSSFFPIVRKLVEKKNLDGVEKIVVYVDAGRDVKRSGNFDFNPEIQIVDLSSSPNLTKSQKLSENLSSSDSKTFKTPIIIKGSESSKNLSNIQDRRKRKSVKDKEKRSGGTSKYGKERRMNLANVPNKKRRNWIKKIEKNKARLSRNKATKNLAKLRRELLRELKRKIRSKRKWLVQDKSKPPERDNKKLFRRKTAVQKTGKKNDPKKSEKEPKPHGGKKKSAKNDPKMKFNKGKGNIDEKIKIYYARDKEKSNLKHGAKAKRQIGHQNLYGSIAKIVGNERTETKGLKSAEPGLKSDLKNIVPDDDSFTEDRSPSVKNVTQANEDDLDKRYEAMKIKLKIDEALDRSKNGKTCNQHLRSPSVEIKLNPEERSKKKRDSKSSKIVNSQNHVKNDTSISKLKDSHGVADDAGKVAEKIVEFAIQLRSKINQHDDTSKKKVRDVSGEQEVNLLVDTFGSDVLGITDEYDRESLRRLIDDIVNVEKNVNTTLEIIEERLKDMESTTRVTRVFKTETKKTTKKQKVKLTTETPKRPETISAKELKDILKKLTESDKKDKRLNEAEKKLGIMIDDLIRENTRGVSNYQKPSKGGALVPLLEKIKPSDSVTSTGKKQKKPKKQSEKKKNSKPSPKKEMKKIEEKGRKGKAKKKLLKPNSKHVVVRSKDLKKGEDAKKKKKEKSKSIESKKLDKKGKKEKPKKDGKKSKEAEAKKVDQDIKNIFLEDSKCHGKYIGTGDKEIIRSLKDDDQNSVIENNNDNIFDEEDEEISEDDLKTPNFISRKVQSSKKDDHSKRKKKKIAPKKVSVGHSKSMDKSNRKKINKGRNQKDNKSIIKKGDKNGHMAKKRGDNINFRKNQNDKGSVIPREERHSPSGSKNCSHCICDISGAVEDLRNLVGQKYGNLLSRIRKYNCKSYKDFGDEIVLTDNKETLEPRARRDLRESKRGAKYVGPEELEKILQGKFTGKNKGTIYE